MGITYGFHDDIKMQNLQNHPDQSYAHLKTKQDESDNPGFIPGTSIILKSDLGTQLNCIIVAQSH